MDLLSSKFKARISQLEFFSNFKKKGDTYYRVINDVMQNVILTKYYGQRRCTLEFSITPLCHGIDNSLITAAMYSIKEFEPQPQLDSWRQWDYDRYSDWSTSDVVDQMMYYVEKHLIPFFEKTITCQKALPEVIELEKLFYRNWIQTADNCGGTIYFDYAVEVSYDYRKLCMALKSHDSEIAKKCLLRSLKNVLSAKEKNKDFASEETKAEYNQRIDWLNQAIPNIEQNNYSFFDGWLAEGENLSKKTLKIK